ncbi:MAG: DUF1223 domain-containing protein [Myxococcales bacterium]|nr:DUF1223 domain-containing protein [Myxococcales bacterium]
MGRVAKCVWAAALLTACAGELSEAEPAPEESPDGPGFAVLELYTSEGCNACPRAEYHLNLIEDDYDDQPVLPMAWHIDYWDYLGWRDPYGDPRYTERQEDYKEALGTTRRYTPQAIVNGQTHFVGSVRRAADEHIAAALERGSYAEVLLTLTPAEDEVHVAYDVIGGREADELHVVLVQSGLANTPDAGENRGVLLEHDNVVRRWSRVVAGSGELSLQFPADGPRDFDVLAWVQDEDTKRMGGATKATVETTP